MHSGFPAPSLAAMRRGFHSIGVEDNDVLVFSELMDSASSFLTANCATVYLITFIDVTERPMVLDISAFGPRHQRHRHRAGPNRPGRPTPHRCQFQRRSPVGAMPIHSKLCSSVLHNFASGDGGTSRRSSDSLRILATTLNLGWACTEEGNNRRPSHSNSDASSIRVPQDSTGHA